MYGKESITTNFLVSILLKTAMASLFMAVCLFAKAASDEYGTTGYARWKALPSARLDRMADAFLGRMMSDSALVCYSIMANRIYTGSLSKGDRYLAVKATNNLGYLYSVFFYDYNKAFRYYSEAGRLAEANGYDDLRATCYLNMGSLYGVYDFILDSDKMKTDAMEAYRKAFYMSLRKKDWQQLTLTVINIVNVANAGKSIKGVGKELRLFLDSYIPASVPMSRYTKAVVKGFMAYNSKDYRSALRIFDSTRRFVNSKDTPARYIITTEACCMMAYGKMGEHGKALEKAMLIDAISRKYGYKDITLSNLSDIESILEAMGRHGEARKYKLKYLELKDSIIASTKVNDVREIKFLNDMNKINDKVRLLSKQKKRQSAIINITLVVLVALFVVVVCVLSYRKVRKRRNVLVPTDMPDEAPLGCKYANSTLTEDDKDRLFGQIKDILEHSEEVYDGDFSLNKLAELAGTHYRYVSQVVNERCGKNFKQLLNSYRIKEACRRLSDSEMYGKMTIEAVAAGVGFKSRSNFMATFKRETGMTPTQYMHQGVDKKI